MMSDDTKQEWPGEDETSPLATAEESQEAGAEAPADGEFVTEDTAQLYEAEPESRFGETEPMWMRVRRAVFGGGYKPDDPVFLRRVTELSQAIDHAPEAPTNYVLRGELYLRARLYELARDDFRAAAELAEAQFERSDWGVLAQTTRDRALIGLTKAEKKLLL
jgi:hypothetical protein